ncbi:hypothetical protein GJAV_G00013440 [Gymnothorax javanicus]|nr:hypothetical protein GJAV_G00013440 [Gymnothorax javanicus]
MISKAKVASHRRLSTYVVDNMKTSKPESERDSGFSDGSSGYLSAVDQMDPEEAGRQCSQTTSQVAVMTGSYPNISPMIIMNNVVLKQPNTGTPALKPWGFQPALEMLPQPQVVFLQPVVTKSSSASQKSPPDKRRKSRKYLPILKSYPKIAPHPGESLAEKGGSGSSGQSSLASGQERRHRHRLKRDSQPVCPMPLTSSQATSATKSSPAYAEEPAPLQLPSASPNSATESNGLASWSWPVEPEAHTDRDNPDPLPDSQSKQQRFCNTYNILRKSGLLGITLRTKELIRLNRRTQSQLEQLRLHTSLFMEAVCSNDPEVWTKLQLAMMEDCPAGVEKQEAGEKDALGTLP